MQSLANTNYKLIHMMAKSQADTPQYLLTTYARLQYYVGKPVHDGTIPIKTKVKRK